MLYDLVIGGGRVLDPSQNIDGGLDVGISDGRIAVLADRIERCQAETYLDATGLVVTPGLVDVHVHVYPGVSHYGVEADRDVLASGVTTALDAGSAGAETFEGLRRYVIDVSDIRLFAMLNISGLGMIGRRIAGELEDIRWANPDRAIQVCEKHRDVILGVKIRLTRNLAGENALPALRNAREAADAVGLPVMVHPQDAVISLETILAELKAGDLVTHCFHGNAGGVLDTDGTVLRCVHDAIERGVRFDVGHGEGSFDYEIAEKAMAGGMIPHTISSDLHAHNVNGPVFDLATTMSKFVLLGMEPSVALRKCTETPAEYLGMKGEIGTLRPGAHADVALFELCEGVQEFIDAEGRRRTGDLRFVPRHVVMGGSLRKATARGYVDTRR